MLNIAAGNQTDSNTDDFEIFRFQIETTRNSKDSLCTSNIEVSSPYNNKVTLPLKYHQLNIKQKKRKAPGPKQPRVNKMFKHPGLK